MVDLALCHYPHFCFTMKITPNTFFTADTHFGHEKLIELQGRNQDFDQEIITAWNSVVSKQDVVIHLGDLTMISKEKTAKITQQLKGRKYLIRGNHDTASEGWYKDCGFIVLPKLYETFCVDDVWYNFVFTHEPVASLPLFDGWFNVHGHLHGNSHRGIAPDGFHYCDVGVDAIGYKPIRLAKVIEYLLT